MDSVNSVTLLRWLLFFSATLATDEVEVWSFFLGDFTGMWLRILTPADNDERLGGRGRAGDS